MKILYGVQGTGNGHITRARALNAHFRSFGMQVDFLFSGRAPSLYFDMDAFGTQVRYRQGLTFAYAAGRIQVGATLRKNDPRQFWRDVRELDLSGYDAVITDFEPITAWAARRQRIPTIGIGHQYAFRFDVPKAGHHPLATQIMKHFAPVDHPVGLHWHHFNAPILPPIAETPCTPVPVIAEKILVYLGFEELDDVLQFLEPFRHHLFVIYGPFSQYQSFGNVQLKPLCREGFCRDLASANGVISNAGFELASEAIHLGKKLLVKPVGGQMEQMANARALEDLGLGLSMMQLDQARLCDWLMHFRGKRVIYPAVARAIVEWVSQGQWSSVQTLADGLWQQVRETAVEDAIAQPMAIAASA